MAEEKGRAPEVLPLASGRLEMAEPAVDRARLLKKIPSLWIDRGQGVHSWALDTQPPCALLSLRPVILRAGPETPLAPCHPALVLLGPFHPPCFRGKQRVFWADPGSCVRAPVERGTKTRGLLGCYCGEGDTVAPSWGRGHCPN